MQALSEIRAPVERQDMPQSTAARRVRPTYEMLPAHGQQFTLWWKGRWVYKTGFTGSDIWKQPCAPWLVPDADTWVRYLVQSCARHIEAVVPQ
jgi:hypothetical protein